MTYGSSVDTRILLTRLIAYRKSLETHLNQLGSEYVQLANRWQMFNSVAEGNYADQFRSGWLKTDAQFKVYNSQSLKIKSFLDERIEFLASLNGENLEIYNQYSNYSGDIATFCDTSEVVESLNASHSWDIDEQTVGELNQFYDKNTAEDKKDLSQYIGETYGHKMVHDILGYTPILSPEDKYKSFPQGLDGIYLDSEETIVVTEFKGQNSPLSDLQKKEDYVNYVCKKIIEGKDPPYTNAPQAEKEFAQDILRELENGGNVRYEVYRTKFYPESGKLSTNLERRYFPELSILSSKNSEVKGITSKPSILDKIIEGSKEYQEDFKNIIKLRTMSQDSNLMDYERQEATQELSNILKIFTQKVYSSGTLSRIEKARITRALNGLEAKPKPKRNI